MLSRFKFARVPAVFAVALVMAGCASKAPAPVSDRSRPGSAATSASTDQPAPPPRVARPGYYIVKPGDVVQFERLGYFAADPDQRGLFHRTVGLRDEWAAAQKRG